MEDGGCAAVMAAPGGGAVDAVLPPGPAASWDGGAVAAIVPWSPSRCLVAI